jgi:hypothetical protein
MYLIAIAWIYVALMMALAEAVHPQGGVLGAVFTFLLYGVGPLALVLYLVGTPMRRRNAARQDLSPPPTAAEPTAASATEAATPGSGLPPDQGGHAARDTVAPKREVP